MSPEFACNAAINAAPTSTAANKSLFLTLYMPPTANRPIATQTAFIISILPGDARSAATTTSPASAIIWTFLVSPFPDVKLEIAPQTRSAAAASPINDRNAATITTPAPDAMN